MESSSAVTDEIWELIREIRRDMKIIQAGMEELRADAKEFRAEINEFRVRMEELRVRQRETDRQIETTGRQLSKTDIWFDSEWSRLVDFLVEGNLEDLLQSRGIEVRQTFSRTNLSFTGDNGEVRRKEFAVLVTNSIEAVAVEVDTTLTPGRVKCFLSAMEDFKRYFPDFRSKSAYGAVAYLRSKAEAALFAERQGLFVIRATGDSASIVNSEAFRPKTFPSGG